MVPQLAPAAAQVVGLHSQRLGVPLAAQRLGGVHVPQSSTPPQPSAMVPHSAPALAHVFGVHPH
jgi:hypothetical protein